jgi:SAM-dependent methyltransferase
MSWTAGYVTDINYTYGYYRELNPALLRLACINAGYAAPPAGSLNYLELGFGQGLAINAHAAAFQGEYWGLDFIPAQAAHARALAAAAGSGAVLLDDSFQEFAARTDVPEFDVIALHGIWSWVSDEARRAIVDILRRRLKVGGIAYISYNCFPAWAQTVPLRHLLTLHAELAGSESAGTIRNIDAALAFAQRVVDAGAHYFMVNSGAADRLKTLAGQERHYLAHEYFNRDWTVMPFADVARQLDQAKLTYVASAHLVDQIDAANLRPEWQQMLGEIEHPVLRQSVRDFLTNQQFRRDIYVKGPRPLSALDRIEALRDQSFVLTTRPEDIQLRVTGSLGSIPLDERICRPLIDGLFAQDYAPKTLGELAAGPGLREMPIAEHAAVLMILAGMGHVHPAQAVTKEARERCAALNRHLCERARSNSDIGTLVSPVTGAGIAVENFQQLFLLAAQHGRKTTAEQAAFTWDILAQQGKRLFKQGQPLSSPEDCIAELTAHATQFAETRLPLLRALGVA